VDINEVLSQLKEKYDVVSSLFYGTNYKEWKKLLPEELSRLTMLAYDKVCKDENTRKDFIRNFIALKKLYALASPHPEVYEIKEDLRFFEMIKKMVVKYSTAKIKDVSRDLEYEISHLISKSISSEEPVDVLTLMGKEKPDVSIFDDKFLAEFKNMEYKNFAIELLAKIIKDQLVVKMKNNPYRYRSLYEMLQKIIEKYNVKILDTIEIIEQLVNLAKEIKQAAEEGRRLNLNEKELAFYDLLSSKQKFFENYKEIEEVAREIVGRR